MTQLPVHGALLVLASIGCATAAAQVKPASNDPPDPEAIFDKGMFMLRTPKDAKDVYIIFLEAPGEKPRTLTLPAGSSGLRMSESALPKGDWKWRFALVPAVLPPIPVKEPVRLDVTYSDLLRYGDAVHLNWIPVKDAASYRVTSKAAPIPADPSAEPRWGSPANADLSVEEYVNAERNVGFYDLPVKAGTRVEWTVTALDANKQPLAKSAPMTLNVGAPWSEDLAKAGWKLQRSDTLSKDTASKAALFGYASNQKAGSPVRSRAYQSEFAVIWDGTKQGGDPRWYPRASLEARLNSSGAGKDSDALKFRLGAYRELKGSLPAEIVANLKYETDSKEDTKKCLFELAYTPTFEPFHQYYPKLGDERRNAAGNFPPDALPWFQWMTQLTLGADVGKTFSVGSSKEVRKTNLRQKATFRLDTKLNGIAYALRVPQVDLYLTSTYWHLSREANDEFTYSSIGMTLQFTKELSLEAVYSVGADAPKFTFTRTGTVGFGLKF